MCWSVGYAQAKGRGEGFVMYPCAVAAAIIDARTIGIIWFGMSVVSAAAVQPKASFFAALFERRGGWIDMVVGVRFLKLASGAES
jgi:hypothetical protein